MNCPTCGAEISDASADRVCTRCALSQALNFSAAPGGAATLDGYEMLHELGRGAMGVVWLAREKMLNRLVALKVIGGDSDPLLAQRLMREGQAVARLSHPHIVAIHSLGGSGAQTFLAMDFAEGGNLAAKLDGTPIDPASAATLVAKLAGAVAHAHAAGIVHRDIKPSNVLLSASDEPQLGDFGLAGPLEGRGDLTRTGQVVGTPAYLAPELLSTSASATPAADIYGLGAVLYFCLTARAPFVAESTAALLHQVANADPVSPRLLQPGVPRDLETICLKCLSKTPGKRYVSAAALQEDLARFLRHEPIAARPIGAFGKTLRWSRRHPNLAAGLALAAIVTLLFAIGGPVVALRLERSRRAAESAAAESAATTRFLQTDLLGQNSSINQYQPDLKLQAAVDRAASNIDERFAHQPAIRVSLHETVGGTYLALGDYKSARTHLVAAYTQQLQLSDLDDPVTLRIREKLAAVYLFNPANYPLVELTARSTWRKQLALLGPDHSDTQISQDLIGSALRYLGRHHESEQVFLPLLEIRRRTFGPEDWETLGTMNNLAIAYMEQGKYAEAEAMDKPALEIFRRKFGPENLGTLRTMNVLAIVYTRAGRTEEGLAVSRELAEHYQHLYGPESPQTMQMMTNFGAALLVAGHFDEALDLYQKQLPIRQRVSGPNDPETLIVTIYLSNSLRFLGRYAEAESYAKPAVAGFQRAFGPEHPATFTAMFALGSIYKMSDRPAEAESVMRAVLTGRQKRLGPTHTETLLAEIEVGDTLLRQARFAEAEVPLREVLDFAAKTPWDEWKKALARSRLGEALLSQNKLAEAEPLLLEGQKGLDDNAAKMPVYTAFERDRAKDRLVHLYTAEGKPDLAAKWRAPVAASPAPAAR